MDIKQEIQEAILDYLNGDFSQNQADILLKWLSNDEKNIEYLKQLENSWMVSDLRPKKPIDLNERLRKIRDDISERGVRKVPAKEVIVRMPVIMGAAAGLLIILSLSLVFLFYPLTGGKAGKLYSGIVEANAPRGSKTFIILPDSTTIWLNSDTRLKYDTDYGRTNRNVFLEGEAYFRVNKKNRFPFQVNTKEIRVTALGTAFNVKAYKDENVIETTLEEGQVSIDIIDVKGSRKPDNQIILKPNQTAVYKRQEASLSFNERRNKDNEPKIQPAAVEIKHKLPVEISDVTDTRLYTSWKDTRWIFRNEKLGSLVPKLERRYNVKIIISDKVVEDYSFTGTLLEESLEQVLAVIRLTAPIGYRITSQEVTLYEDKILKKQYEEILR